MEYDRQLKLQAYLDGELPEAEAKDIANWLAQDSEAVALLSELRQTRETLSGFENGIKLPESREFYWSKIRREIDRLRAPAAAEVHIPLLLRLRRAVLPATAFGILLLAGFFFFRPAPEVADTETAMADTGAMTYRDYDSGATLVWLSYPSDNEVAKNDSPATLQ